MDSAKWMGVVMVSVTLFYILNLNKFTTVPVRELRRPRPLQGINR